MPAPPGDSRDVLVSFFATLIAGSALVVSFSQTACYRMKGVPGEKACR